MSNTSIPEDLMIEILLRLPVKSLKRFKCVCRYWFSLIEDPDFVRKHYHTNAITCANLQALVWNIDGYDTVVINGTESISERNHLSLLSMETMQARERIVTPLWWYMIGDSQGIIVLFDYGELHLGLLNPSTREFKSAPESIIIQKYGRYNADRESNFLFGTLGFGYDSKTDDYKVVRFLLDFTRRSTSGYFVELYTLKTNSWKEICDPGLCCQRVVKTCFTTYINGCYHWFLDHGESILAFDMTQETFHTMDSPLKVGKNRWCHCYDLRLFHNCLAIFENSKENIPGCYTIWLMKDYGFKESWSKHLIVGPIPNLKELMGMWKTGEWFFTNNNDQLALYDPRNNLVKDVQIRNCAFTYGPKEMLVVIYNESLRSLNGRYLNDEILEQ